MIKELYDVGEAPPLGAVPEKMHAWLIRPERFGEPMQAFQQEVVHVPSIADDEVLVYVMAAGVNYNNVWAALGTPIDVIAARNKAGEREAFHIGGSDASGIVYKVGQSVTNFQVGDEVVIHCGSYAATCPTVRAGTDPMYSPTFRIWGYETNWGSFAQFTRVQAHQLCPKPRHMSWESAAAYMLVGATAYRMLMGWSEHAIRKGDVVLIWGGAGGLGSMAIQICSAVGAIPIAVVSGEDKVAYCKNLGAVGCIDRRKFDHWGMLPHWKDAAGYNAWLKGARAFGAAVWDVLGEKRSPRVVFEHPGESTIPTSLFVCDTGGMVVICAGTSGYNATVDLRYLWMRQKRVQGSHFANDTQCYALNDLAVKGYIDPCLSRIFTYGELPMAHQLMFENKHPHGNMAVLVGTPARDLGSTAEPPAVAGKHVALPEDDKHDTPHPYPMSVPLPGITSQLTDLVPAVVEDDTQVGAVMRSGLVSCAPTDTIAAAVSMMVEHDVHALVVIENHAAVGVLSQTDVVLARQGRSSAEVRHLTVRDVMSSGCITCDSVSTVTEAVSTMTRLRIHRLVVTRENRPVGVLSMTDIVNRLVGA
ncbi:Crotonyl-CoA carboxylase/reductase, ethylmalonyl-CoA producing [invertebrate metagenome]|uniref:Crotonyl-CoA carboxylase/reductase, ethylmalonyl-CoA producing n=1 Tax=invertebrate metagenome TaxID=1711999 RepID=A0A484H4L0_9ZZZZ